MPCNLTADRHVLVMTDAAGETYELYHRLLTNAERAVYVNSLYESGGKKAKLKKNIFPEQVALGRKICLGFSEGYFMDGDKFISSDPSKPYFRKDWLGLLEAARPTDLQQIALQALRPSSVAAGSDDIDVEPTPSEDAADSPADVAAQEQPEAADVPLEKSS